MAETAVTFGPGGIRSKALHGVLTREDWDDTWTVRSNLHCTEATWSCAPSMPTASFSWLYGQVKQTNATEFAEVDRLEIDRHFIQVVFGTDDGSRPWYGIIESQNDLKGGADVNATAGTSLDTGRQIFQAYGLEKLLADHEIINAVIEISGPGLSSFNDHPPTFNAGGRPNMSHATYLNGSHIFAADPDTALYWSTAEIVKYLLEYQTPLDRNGALRVQFRLRTPHSLPTWDRPVIEQEGYRTYDLLDRLINRRRMYTWHLEVNSDVELVADTMLTEAVELDLPGANPIPANPNQRWLQFDADQYTTANLKSSELQTVDQVVVRGARRRSIASFSVGDGTLREAWTSTAGLAYARGASPASDWADLGTKERQKRNEEFRSSPLLDAVYSLFAIPGDWDRKVKGGENKGPVRQVFTVPLSAEPYPVYYPELEIQQTLAPLTLGVDYSSDKITYGTYTLPPLGDQADMPPLVVFKVPGSQRWIEGDKIGRNADKEITGEDEYDRFSTYLRIPRDGKAVQVHVTGAPRHVIDGLNFVSLDDDEPVGKWSYKLGDVSAGGQSEAGAIFTLAVADDRYCEGRWPPTVSSLRSVVRRKVIWAGDGYRQDYIVPFTVVGVDEDGALIRTFGGEVPPTHAGDDRRKLIAIAKLASEFYTRTHKVLLLSTGRLRGPTVLQLGDIVTQIGDPGSTGGHRETINTPITEITFRSPMATPQSDQHTEMTLTTWAGELDPLLLVPPAPVIGPPSPSDEGRRLFALASRS